MPVVARQLVTVLELVLELELGQGLEQVLVLGQGLGLGLMIELEMEMEMGVVQKQLQMQTLLVHGRTHRYRLRSWLWCHGRSLQHLPSATSCRQSPMTMCFEHVYCD